MEARKRGEPERSGRDILAADLLAPASAAGDPGSLTDGMHMAGGAALQANKKRKKQKKAAAAGEKSTAACIGGKPAADVLQAQSTANGLVEKERR